MDFGQITQDIELVVISMNACNVNVIKWDKPGKIKTHMIIYLIVHVLHN